MDLSNQEALEGDPKSIPQINFNWNLDQQANFFFFLLKRLKKLFSIFSKELYKYFNITFCFNINDNKNICFT